MRNGTPELDKLFEEVGTYRSTKDYRELLFFVRKFRHYAPYNAMLLHIQKPGSTYVASAADWQSRFQRKPIPGARPLVILRPFGPVAFVYELGDTEGKAFPKELAEPFSASGMVSRAMVDSFIQNMLYSGVNYHEQDYGSDSAGFVQWVGSRAVYTSPGGKKKHYSVPFSMVVNENLDNAAKLATIYHELGHVFCGHLSAPSVKFLPQRPGLPLKTVEFEAESVCWLLCERQGIHNPSAAYLSGYLDENEEIPPISIETVLKAVGAIEQIRAGLKAPRKELVIGE